jgi:cation:H+ antiporter
MIAVAIACLPVFFTGNLIARWEGFIFMGYYIAYTVYLILSSTQHSSLPVYSNIMLWFVIPITVITLITIFLRERQSSSPRQFK